MVKEKELGVELLAHAKFHFTGKTEIFLYENTFYGLEQGNNNQ